MAQKKSERMRLRVTEDMAREIRALADLEHRSVQDQARYLMAVGLKHIRSGVGNELVAEAGAMPYPSVPRKPLRNGFAEEPAKSHLSLPGTRRTA